MPAPIKTTTQIVDDIETAFLQFMLEYETEPCPMGTLHTFTLWGDPNQRYLFEEIVDTDKNYYYLHGSAISDNLLFRVAMIIGRIETRALYHGRRQ
jgi:hypothetical protein